MSADGRRLPSLRMLPMKVCLDVLIAEHRWNTLKFLRPTGNAVQTLSILKSLYYFISNFKTSRQALAFSKPMVATNSQHQSMVARFSLDINQKASSQYF